ncbi:MAG: hypothetical protein JNM09_14150 [Blastocatellia bacterium]|nr:hypothetical protein [Blastocatellia bacterium]
MIVMLKNLKYVFVFLMLTCSSAFSQTKSLTIGGINLRIGMQREAVMKILTDKYNVLAVAENTFAIREYDKVSNSHVVLGSIVFEGNQLSYISREIDTSGWPNDEGYAVARAIYLAIDGTIPITDSDGVKRSDAKILISNVETSKPSGSIRRINILINNHMLMLRIFDSEKGKSVGVTVAVQAKAW